MIPTIRNQWRDQEDAARKKPRRISFKTKTPTRRISSKPSKLSVNKVQQLAEKYNQLVTNDNLKEQPKIAKAVRRVNSCRKTDERTPNKTKLNKTNSNNSVKRKPSVRQDKHYVKAKISYLETPKKLNDDKNLNNVPNESKKSILGNIKPLSLDSTSNRVKAAIEIFEKRTSSDERVFTRQSSEPNEVFKPKVPDKNVVKTKELVYKNGVPKLKTLRVNEKSDQTIEEKSEQITGVNKRATTLPRIGGSDTKLSELQIYFENKKNKTADNAHKTDDDRKNTKKTDDENKIYGKTIVIKKPDDKIQNSDVSDDVKSKEDASKILANAISNLKTTNKVEIFKPPQRGIKTGLFGSKFGKSVENVFRTKKVEEKDTSDTYLSVENQKIIAEAKEKKLAGDFKPDFKPGRVPDNSKTGRFTDESKTGTLTDESKTGRSTDEFKAGRLADDSKTGRPADESKTGILAGDFTVKKSADDYKAFRSANDSRTGNFTAKKSTDDYKAFRLADDSKAGKLSGNITAKKSADDFKAFRSAENSKANKSADDSKAGRFMDDYKIRRFVSNFKTDKSAEDSKPDRSAGDSKTKESTDDSKVKVLVNVSKAGRSTDDSTANKSDENSKSGGTIDASKAGTATDDFKAGRKTDDSKADRKTGDSKVGKSIDDSKSGEKIEDSKSDGFKSDRTIDDSKLNDDLKSNKSSDTKIPEEPSAKLSPPRSSSKAGSKKIYESLNIARTTHPNKLISSKTITIECNDVKPNNSFLWRSKLNTTVLNDKTKNYIPIIISQTEKIDGKEKIYENRRESEKNLERIYENSDEIMNKSDEAYEKLGDEKPERIYEKLDEVREESKKLSPKLDDNKEKSHGIYEKSVENKKKSDDYEKLGDIKETHCDNFEDLYDVVDPPKDPPNKTDNNKQDDAVSEHSYELFEYTYEKIGTDYEYVEGVYETLPVRNDPQKDIQESAYYYESEENVYWTVDPNMAKRKLPPRPGSPYDDNASNCYESIYDGDKSKKKNGSDNNSSCGSNRDSIISCDQKSNSLYGRYGWGGNTSDMSDRSDEWVDVSDPEESETGTGFVIVRERQRVNKTGGWSDKVRNQWSKNTKDGPSPLDPGHLYESLDDDDFDYDSFDSDSEEDTPNKTNQNDSGVDVCNGRLPSPPSNVYSLVKQMMKLRPNWSITKSLTRINKAGTSETQPKPKLEISKPIPTTDIPKQYENVEVKTVKPDTTEDEKRNSLGRKSWLKFRRSTSAFEIATSSTPTSSPMANRPQSTFYVTDTIDIDNPPVESKPTVPVRRKSRNVAIRPQSPPPPTPGEKKGIRKSSSKTSSWYTEVGLFKNDIPVISQPEKPSNTSWYAEIGLYLNHDQQISSSSSRENSGSGLQISPVSSEVELRNKRNSHLSNTKTSDEPDEVQVRNSTYIETILGNSEELYQFYSQAVIEKENTGNDSDCEVGYEKISDVAMKIPKSPTPAHRYNRSLWCEIPEVKSSGILDALTANERKLQEAKFEIVSSEVSYLKSLRVLEEHFEEGLKSDDQLTPEERNVLFGRVHAVVECSERLLADLEECWSLSILLPGVCDIILRHSKEYFQVYVTYCENQVFVENTLKSVRGRRGFSEALKQLESSPTCQQLPLFSFLILPMQRITRLPLLIDAVLKRLGSDHEERLGCERALVSLNELTKRCNEAARTAERSDEMTRVMSRLEFPPTVPPLPIEPSNGGRYLVRSGELTQLVSRGEESQTITKLTMVRKLSRLPVHLFLFSDVLVIAKKRGDDRFGVMHHCPRNFIELSEESTSLGSPPALKDRFLLFLTLLENHDMKTIEMVLSCANETDRRRWCEAFTPAKTVGEDETLYETWDCPQVATVHFYTTEQPDELNLVVGDIVNVTRKMADGWYYGERIRDGQTGWFPGNHTVEIVNRHVRARNLRQRYRLLALTGSYISQARAAADQR